VFVTADSFPATFTAIGDYNAFVTTIVSPDLDLGKILHRFSAHVKALLGYEGLNRPESKRPSRRRAPLACARSNSPCYHGIYSQQWIRTPLT
jgi:hypothetical protein